jgi:uncharacterized protein YpuA (DUF1002 family)
LIKEDGSSPTSCPYGDPFDDLVEEEGVEIKAIKSLILAMESAGTDSTKISNAWKDIKPKLKELTNKENLELLRILRKNK